RRVYDGVELRATAAFFCRRGMGMTRRYCKGKRAASLVGVFARGPGPPCEINDLVACVCELTGARVLCCFAMGGAQHIGDRLLESTGGRRQCGHGSKDI